MKNCMKKFIHKFIIDDRGAVSIYLIIVTLLLFLFNAVLIDYARIIVAERQTDQAAKVALRSTMSSYHQDLQDYGLFAFNGDEGDATAIFEDVFEKNLQAGDGEGFHFVAIEPEEGEVTTSLNLDRGLANKEILTHQVLEEMKYQAPVEIGEALIEGFLSISDDMEKASVITDIIRDIEDDVEERDEKLDEAIELLESAKGKLDDSNDSVHSQNRSTYPAVNNLEDLFFGHLEYLEVYPLNPPSESDEDDEDDEDKTDEELEEEEETQDNADTFKENAQDFVEELISTGEEVEEDLKDALDLIEQAEELNDEINETIADAEESKEEIYEGAQSQDESDLDTGDSSQMDTVLESMDDFVLDQEMLSSVIDEVEDAILDVEAEGNRTDGFNPKLEEIEENIDNDFKNRNGNQFGDYEESGDIYHTRLYHNQVSTHTNNAISLLEDGRTEFEDDEMEEKEDEADDNLEELADEMDEMEEEFGNDDGESTIYEDLEVLVEKYEGAIEENGEQFDLEDKDDTATEAMGFIDTLFEGLGNLLISGRDRLYFNEYILTRFSHHTFPTEGDEAKSFENNQVEYIIYGHSSFGKNYSSAMSEIFALRFAINLVEALKTPRTKVFGPYFWVAALADAFLATSENMETIRSGNPVVLIPGKLETLMSYKDHLRLFLFAHPDGKTRERVMAVLEHETEADLTESSTYITANASASIELWFIPGMMEMLGHAGALSGRVEGKTYYFDKEINYAY